MSKAKELLRMLEQDAPGASLADKVTEFASLKKELDSLKSRIEIISAKSEILEKELVPLVKEAQEQMVIADKAIVKYKTRKTTSVGYKPLFDTALTKVNEQTKALLEDLKEKSTSRGTKEYLDVTYESKFTDLLNKFKSWISSTWDKLFGVKEAVEELVNASGRE